MLLALDFLELFIDLTQRVREGFPTLRVKCARHLRTREKRTNRSSQSGPSGNEKEDAGHSSAICASTGGAHRRRPGDACAGWCPAVCAAKLVTAHCSSPREEQETREAAGGVPTPYQRPKGARRQRGPMAGTKSGCSSHPLHDTGVCGFLRVSRRARRGFSFFGGKIHGSIS